MIYWVAIEELPTKKETEEQNALPRLVHGPVAIEARDDKDAAIKVAIGNKELEGIDKNRLQVVVRPF